MAAPAKARLPANVELAMATVDRSERMAPPWPPKPGIWLPLSVEDVTVRSAAEAMIPAPPLSSVDADATMVLSRTVAPVRSRAPPTTRIPAPELPDAVSRPSRTVSPASDTAETRRSRTRSSCAAEMVDPDAVIATESVRSRSPDALASSSAPTIESTGSTPGAIAMASGPIRALVSSIAARRVQEPPALAHTPSPTAASAPSVPTVTVSVSAAVAPLDAPSTAPMSQALPCGRATPRWSVATVPSQSPAVPAGMASIAGEPAMAIIVRVGPPLSASPRSIGSTPT